MCEYALDHGWKSYRGHQIFQWLYRNRVFDIDEMTNVSKETTAKHLWKNGKSSFFIKDGIDLDG